MFVEDICRALWDDNSLNVFTVLLKIAPFRFHLGKQRREVFARYEFGDPWPVETPGGFAPAAVARIGLHEVVVPPPTVTMLVPGDAISFEVVEYSFKCDGFAFGHRGVRYKRRVGASLPRFGRAAAWQAPHHRWRKSLGVTTVSVACRNLTLRTCIIGQAEPDDLRDEVLIVATCRHPGCDPSSRWRLAYFLWGTKSCALPRLAL